MIRILNRIIIKEFIEFIMYEFEMEKQQVMHREVNYIPIANAHGFKVNLIVDRRHEIIRKINKGPYIVRWCRAMYLWIYSI